MSRIILVAALTVISIAISHSAAEAQTLRVSATTTVRETMLSKIKDSFEKETGAKLELYQREGMVGNHAYLKALIDGHADVAIAAVSFDQWAKQSKENNIDLPPDLVHQVVAMNQIKVISNKANNVAKMNLEQTSDIFSGKVKNWKEFGGADLPVKVFLYGDKQGKNASFKRFIFKKNDDFLKDAVQVKGDEDEVLAILKKTPGGISFHSNVQSTEGLTEIVTPPIGRPTTLVVKGKPSDTVLKLIKALREASKE